MKLISTRNENNSVNFERAILDCMPEDGGLYVPEDFADLRRWILYTNETTTFASISGALTSAFLNEEFSPIICETIATKAFKFEPVVKKIDERLFTLELFNTPTGSHKDFGISFLVNCLETILTLKGRNAIFLDATIGELGASLARALKGKKHLKGVLLYPKGLVRGLCEEDYVWNGGNIYPIEINGTEADCHKIVREIFSNRSLVEKLNLTVANTANIGRLIPQSFFYPFAFSRLRKQVSGDIFYAMPPGNYSNLVAGLYSWKLSLPVNGFITPTTEQIKLDFRGNCEVMDSIVDFSKREKSDPASPSNLERLENIFSENSLMLKNFVFPAEISEKQEGEACQELFTKFGLYADKHTSRAYAAAKANADVFEDEDSCVVLVMRDHPSLSCDFIHHNLGESPEIPDFIQKATKSVIMKRETLENSSQVLEILNSVAGDF